MWLVYRVMSPNEADRIANSVDPDQTAPLSGSALFAQAYLSENLGHHGSFTFSFGFKHLLTWILCSLLNIDMHHFSCLIFIGCKIQLCKPFYN